MKKKNVNGLKRNSDDIDMKKLSNLIVYKNMINKNNIDYSKLTKEELIEMMQQKDQQLAEQNKVKHVPKPIKRTPKKGPSQKNMSNETDEMADIRKTNKQLKSELELTTMKYNRLFRKSEVLKYPKVFVSIDRFRKEEASLASDFKKGSSFVNLFKNRLESIKGNRDIVSITLYVDITDENDKTTEEKTYGPFETEIPRLKKSDMYKFMVYILMENKFNLLSAQVISKIGCDILTHNKEFFMKHKMGSLKLVSYLLSDQRKIKSHGKNTCVLDYVWDQVRSQKGFRTYDYDKLKDELYSYSPDSPKINTEELINWAKECHPNVSIHAYDSTYKKFVTHTNYCSNISLVYIVKDHHCFPITDEKLKKVASQANHGGAKNLLKYMTDIKWTRRHENVYELQYLEEVTFANKKKCIMVLPEDVKMTEAIRKYIDCSKFYVEYLHWNNVGILDGFIDHNENMYLLNDNYKERKSICDKMYGKFKTHDFIWTNQSFTSLSSALFRQIYGYLQESTYNTKTRQILDDYYPRALQWCTTDEIPEDVVSIDISKSYPNILINNNSPIPIYSIHDVIEPFSCENDLRQYGEFYLEETVLENFGSPVKIEAGFYSRNLVFYLVDTLNMPPSQIKYKITTKRALKPDTFKCFMEYLFNEFPENEAKRLANSFIGELGRKYNKTNYGFTCTEYETAMCCWTRAMAEGRNVTVNSFNDIFLIKEQSCERIFSDNTSINRFVVSEAILALLQLIWNCRGINRGNVCKLYAYNTDGIFITNPNPKMKLKRKKDVEFKTSRIGHAYITETELVYFEKKYREDMDFGSYVVNHGNGCIFNGQAGSGKTTKLCEMVKNSENPLVLSFTNKAIENIKERLGEKYKDMCHTFDSYFCEWRETDNSLKSKTIFIDEFSMVPNKWMTKIYEIYSKYNNTVYMFGDNNQCEAVENGSHIKYDYQESASISQMCPNKYTMSYIEESCRYDKQTHNILSTFLKHGKVSAYFEPIGEYNKNICYLNKTRKQVTEQCCDRFTKDKKYVTFEFRYDNAKESYKISEGMPLIATTNNKDRQIFNTMEFILEEIKKDNNEMSFKIKENWFSLSEFSRSFIPGFCVTVYKYQGADITEDYNIHDVKWMDKKQLYTALSRTTKLKHIHLTNKELNKNYYVRRQPCVEQVNAKHSQYNNGKIYKVTFSDDKIYIGSTCEELDTRLKYHLSDINSQVYKNKEKNPKIELIINAPCYDKKTLEKIENGYIEEYAEKYENRLLNVRCNPMKKQKKIEYEVSIENDIILRKRIEALELRICIKDNEDNKYWYFDNIVNGMRHQTKSRYVDISKEKALEDINVKKQELIKELTIKFE